MFTRLTPPTPHTQRSEQEQFLCELPVATCVREAVRQLVELHNLRAKIQVLKMEGEELAKHGAAKQPDKQGLDEYAETPVDKGPHYTSDPTGRRTGNGERGGMHGGIRMHAVALAAEGTAVRVCCLPAYLQIWDCCVRRPNHTTPGMPRALARSDMAHQS